jgi:hypothetical protein
MDQPSKSPPAIPETVMYGILTDAFATGSTAGLSWEGHGCSDLLRKWAANQLLTGPYSQGYPVDRKGYLIGRDR